LDINKNYRAAILLVYVNLIFAFTSSISTKISWNFDRKLSAFNELVTVRPTAASHPQPHINPQTHFSTSH